MMEITMYKCDVCGKTKGETNHWWWAVIGDGTLFLAPWGLIGELPGYKDNYDKVVHLCGQSCVMAKVSEIMGAGLVDLWTGRGKETDMGTKASK